MNLYGKDFQKESATQPVNAFILVRYVKILGNNKICEPVWRFRHTY
jgi:hypothetical protein